MRPKAFSTTIFRAGALKPRLRCFISIRQLCRYNTNKTRKSTVETPPTAGSTQKDLLNLVPQPKGQLKRHLDISVSKLGKCARKYFVFIFRPCKWVETTRLAVGFNPKIFYNVVTILNCVLVVRDTDFSQEPRALASDLKIRTEISTKKITA